MEERKYLVKLDGHTIAESMDIETATILVKALFAQYYNDRTMVVSIRKMPVEEFDYDDTKMGEE